MDLPIELWLKIISYTNFNEIQLLIVSVPCIYKNLQLELGNDYVETHKSKDTIPPRLLLCMKKEFFEHNLNITSIDYHCVYEKQILMEY